MKGCNVGRCVTKQGSKSDKNFMGSQCVKIKISVKLLTIFGHFQSIRGCFAKAGEEGVTTVETASNKSLNSNLNLGLRHSGPELIC